VYIAEIVVSLELLTNAMSDSDSVKRAASEVGLANLLHRLWFHCEADAQLLRTVLATLITYTSHCVHG